MTYKIFNLIKESGDVEVSFDDISTTLRLEIPIENDMFCIERLDEIILNSYDEIKKEIQKDHISTVKNFDSVIDLLDIPSYSEVIRNHRNELLSKTDYVVMSDVKMDEQLKIKYLDYRQNLRDITNQDGFPLDIIWPEKP